MADEIAGRLFIELLPDVDKKKFQAAIDASVKGTTATVPTTLKLTKTAVADVKAEATKKLAATKPVALDVKLSTSTGQIRKVVAETNKNLREAKNKPAISVGLKTTATEARRAVREANVELRKAAKKPRLDVQLGLSVKEMELIKQLRVVQGEARVILNQDPIDLRIQLDEKAQASLLSKIALLRERARLVAAAGEERSQLRLNEIEARGVQQRLNIQERLDSQRALIHERSEARVRKSSHETLRILRNDLSQFDASTTRTLRRTGLVFAGFTAGITASFAAIGVASVAAFARTEEAVKKTAAVLASDAFSNALVKGKDATKAFEDAVSSLDGKLMDLANRVALKTIFNPADVALGAKALAQAGLNYEQINNSLLSVAQFAQNEDLDMSDATDKLTSAAYAAGVSLDELVKVSDKFTLVANASQASAADVADAFKNRAAPAFRAYGQTVDQTLTTLLLFSKSGIKGLTGGEQAAILIRFLTQGAEKAGSAWNKYGIQIGKVDGKTVPFTKTLVQLAAKFDEIGKSRGPQGVQSFVKELGLTQKSASGLFQIMPQIIDLGKGLNGAFDMSLAIKNIGQLEAQITKAGGATARQAKVITNTLSFQYEQFTNQIGTLFRSAAEPTGLQLKEIFKELNGELNGSVDIAKQLEPRFRAVGKSLASFIGPALRSFATGGEGEAFFSGLFNMYRGFLVGLRNSFISFRDAAFGPGSKRGFFSVMGDAFTALGNFASRVLPRVGALLGQVTRYIRENKTTVELFVKAWLGLYVAQKALRLFLIPLLGLSNTLSGLGLNLGRFIGAIGSLTFTTEAFTLALGSLVGILRVVARLFIPVTFAFGLLKGIIDGVNESLGGDGNVTMRDFSNAILGIGRAINVVLAPIITLVKWIGKITAFGARLLGLLVVQGLVAAVRALGDAFAWTYQKASNLPGLLKSLIISLVPGAKTFNDLSEATNNLNDSLDGLGNKISGTFGSQSATRVQFGTFMQEVADRWRPHSKNIAEMFDDVAASALRNERNIDSQYQKSSLKRAAIRSYDAIQSALSLQKQVAATNVLGVANDNLLPKYVKLTAAQKSLGLSTKNAAEFATNYQRRQAYLAAVTDVLTGKIRNQSVMQAILANSSSNAGVNLNRLAGGQKGLKSLLEQVAAGNKKAAKTFLALAANAALAAAAVVKAKAQIAQQELDKINAQATGIPSAAVTQSPYVRGLLAQANAGAMADKRAQSYIKSNKDLVKQLQSVSDVAAGAGGGAVGAAGGGTAGAIEKVKTATEQAAAAVNNLSQVQLNKQAGLLVGKVARAAAKGYQATAYEAEILRRTLPLVEAQLERQQAAVAKLDEALQNLQNTQLKGTKAFSDQAFAIEQSIKKLQLQRLDLVIAGAPEQDTAITAIDEQIAKLQQNAERLSLVESLKLDPLRRKLEQTFNPVKELTFDQIIKQFNAIQKQRAPLADAIAGGENLKATLETAIKDAEARFGDAGKQVTAGFAIGIKGATPQVTQAGKVAGNAALAGVNNVMKFGSPSRTMIERGLWVSEGFVQGINSGTSLITSAGVTAMFSFLTGMRNVYENRIQPFIKGIAKWIKENKGPVSYDATLLRPAGEAMMKGFHRGLRDGFSEVKTWVSDVGPDLARHTIPDKIFKKMSAEFVIGNASADMKFDPGEFFASIAPMGEVGVGANFLGQSLGLDDTIKQARMIAQMFGITPNIASARRRFGDPAYNAAIGGAAGSLHIAGRAMDFTGNDGRLTNAANWARKYMEMVFQEVLWQTTGHYDHLHLGWKYGNKKLIADIAGASSSVEQALANAANLTKVDFNLLAAIAKAESGFNPNAVSPVGASGLMQLMPGTARGLGVNNVFDPKQNALGGAKYIKNLLEMFNGNIRIALSGYNAGPGNAMIAMRQFSETIAYIEKVMRYFNQFKSGNYRAQGGKVNSMTPYIVGERGQELFVPSQNGSVISNKDLRDLIGALNGTQPGTATGTTINDNRKFEVISNSTDPATVAALVDARMRSQVVGVRR